MSITKITILDEKVNALIFKSLILAISFIFFFSACTTSNTQQKDPRISETVSGNKTEAGFSGTASVNNQSANGLDSQFQNTIKLEYGFEIKSGNPEDLGDFKTYSLFALKHNNKIIYFENADTEYEFENTLYPILHQINNTTFEILVEVNNRPNNNYLKYFKIENDKIVEIKHLPTFICEAARLENNTDLYYAGIWDDRETWGSNEDTTDYCPILYYKISPKGILLDSALTIAKNTLIYGRFKGFDFDERNPVSLSAIEENFENELDRIKNACK
jgi:hypothetical protein